MGRFDNYIDSQNAKEQGIIDKREAEKTEKELLLENRKREYIPVIKKTLLEFNNVLPRIKRWGNAREFVRGSILGFKTFKEKPIQLIEFRYYNTTDREISTYARTFISKDGRYFKKADYARGLAVDGELTLDEMANLVFGYLPWEPYDSYGRNGFEGQRCDEIIKAIADGNAEEAVYKYFETVLENRV